MDVAKLGQRQLFLMKWVNLERRIIKRYEQTKSVSEVIEYLVAVLVRSAICSEAISEKLQSLIRELFLTAEPDDTLRRHLPYFEKYFKKSERKTLIKRLFKNRTAYLAATEEARGYKKYLEQEGTLDNWQENHAYIMESFFSDANGKRHKLTIREADPTKYEEIISNSLQILTTLTIFEVDGVRKFVNFLNYEGSGKIITTKYSARSEKAQEPTQAAANEKKPSSSEQNKSVAGEAGRTDTGTESTKSVKSEILSDKRENEGDHSTKKTRADSASPQMIIKTESSNPRTSPISTVALPQKTDEKKPFTVPQKTDTSYMTIGKNLDQSQNEEERWPWQRTLGKFLGRNKK